MTSLTSQTHRPGFGGGLGIVLGATALTLALALPGRASSSGSGPADSATDRVTAASTSARAWGVMKDQNLDNFTTLGDWVTVLSRKVTVSKGVLHLTATVAVDDDSTVAGGAVFYFALQVDNRSAPARYLNFAELEFGRTGTATIVVPVNAGRHTVRLLAKATGAYVFQREMSILYLPNGTGTKLPVGPPVMYRQARAR